MELPAVKSPLIQPSWLRVVIFLMAYLGVNLLAYKLFKSNFYFIDVLVEQTAKISGSTNSDYNFMLLLLFGSFIVSVILVYIFRKLVDRQSISSLGFQYRDHIPDAVVGFCIPVVILGALSLILYFNNNLQWIDISFTSQDFLTGLLLMIFIAVGEEMVFRGYILNNLMQSLNKWVALAISAVVFALIHSNNPNIDILAIINLIVGGLLLGINYLFTKNLWFSILLHTLWNFLQGPVLGFAVSGIRLQSILQPELKGNAMITGGSFGLEASILTGILFIITLLILYLVYQQKVALKKTPSV